MDLATLLKDKEIMIVDPHAVSRSGIAKTLSAWGARASQLTLLSSLPSVFEHIQTHCPKLIICEYKFYGGCGLDVLYKLRENFTEKADSSVFILVTSDSSVAAIAHAAEEDVDAFILKPYTIEAFQKTLFDALLQKENPTDYMKTIKIGKEHLKEKNIPVAIEVFSKAIRLSQKPSLAYYYFGHAQQLNKALETAEQSYKNGLRFNKLHYKCLVGLYDALMEQERPKEAYIALKKLSHFFPANPHRLNHVIRLAVQTGNFEDIERYYLNFLDVDVKTDSLVEYVCAAMIVSGKYFLKNRETERGVKLLHNAAVSCGGRVKFFDEIILILIEYNLPEEAKKILSRFPVEEQSNARFKALEYLIDSKIENLSKILEKGRSLLKQGIEEPLVFQVLIEASQKAGHSDTAENLKNLIKRRLEGNKNKDIE